jgi:hypothetical protein
VPANDAAAPVIEPMFRRLRLVWHRRIYAVFGGRSSSQAASSAPAAETPRPRFDGGSKHGGWCGRAWSVVSRGRWCEKKSLWCEVSRGEIRAAKLVAVVAFVLLGGGVPAGALFVALAVSFACCLARANTVSYRLLARAHDHLQQDDRQDRCRHARGHDVPNAVAHSRGSGGSFFTSRPGSILTSVEGDHGRVGGAGREAVDCDAPGADR